MTQTSRINGKLQFKGNFTSQYFMPLQYEEGKKYPTIIVIGHPINARKGMLLKWVDCFIDTAPEDCLIIRTGILDLELNLEDVSHEGDWKYASTRMKEAMARYKEELPMDPDRVVLTGCSFDAGYAWMLAYDQPGQYSGLVTLGSPVYPRRIQEKLVENKGLKMLCAWGEEDSIVPRMGGWDQIRAIASRLKEHNPNAKCIVEEKANHASLRQHWGRYLTEMMDQVR